MGAGSQVWKSGEARFYAVLYQREQLHILAYRGTDDWQVDLIDDATILLGWISSQMGSARDALRASRERLRGVLGGKLCLTGHSLGGGLAALIAAQADLPCVTFNAPGTKRSLKAHYIKGVTGAPFFANMIQDHDATRDVRRTYLEHPCEV